MRVASRVVLTVVVALASLLGFAPAQARTVVAHAVAVGDSVPSGSACGCNPFPVQYADEVADHTGHAFRMINYAAGGATSDSVLRQVRSWNTRAAVHTASLAVVMVGANDFEDSFDRVLHHQQGAVSAYRPVAARMRANVIAIIRRLRVLRPGIRVVVLDYWNVVKDGAVGRRLYGAWGVRVATDATSYANASLRYAAKVTGSTYVSTLREFKGADGRSDPTSLLASDGDHPNARGHAVIARGVFQVASSG